MQVSTALTTRPDSTTATRLLTRSQTITPVNEETETVDKTKATGSPFVFQKKLSPKEEQRVQFLQNLLAQLLTMVEGNPTDEQKDRIRAIEKELEKITGVKTQSSLADMAAKLPGKTDKKKEEEQEKKYQIRGIDPKEAERSNKSLASENDNPGMQMLRNNALFTSIGALALSDPSLSTSRSKY